MSNDAEQLAKANEHIRTLIETLKEDGQFGLDVVTDALSFLRSNQSSFRPVPRGHLISQLRHALYLAESPVEEVVEFEIGDTEFCFEYEGRFVEETGDTVITVKK